jgi:hypothetical protein
VAGRLKELGWTFASHGYAHLHTVAVTDEKLRSDSQKWVNETQNVVGPTQIYVWPFGNAPPTSSSKRRLLTDEFGFRMFDGVDTAGALVFEGDSARLDRKPVDGLSLRAFRARYADLFDTAAIFDSEVRAKLNPAAGGVK